MNTLLPSGLMKSGLLTSRPSARKATFTPLPVESCCAVGVDRSVEAVLVSCRASGSSSGLAGLVGQTLLETTPLTAVDVPERSGSTSLTALSGTTAATDGSARSLACSAALAVAAKALTTCSCLSVVPPDALTDCTNRAWSDVVTATRRPTLACAAGTSAC